MAWGCCPSGLDQARRGREGTGCWSRCRGARCRLRLPPSSGRAGGRWLRAHPHRSREDSLEDPGPRQVQQQNLQPFAVQKVASGAEAKAHGRHPLLDEIPMRSKVRQPVGARGQVDAALTQLLRLLRSGLLEVHIDSTALELPRGSPHGGWGGTAHENQHEPQRQSHEATMRQRWGPLKDVRGSHRRALLEQVERECVEDALRSCDSHLARQHAFAWQRQAGPGAAMPLRGAWRTGAGAFVTSGGRPHRLSHEAPAAGRHHAPALHRAGTFTACGVPGACASGKPHEVPRRLCSRLQTAAISGPPSGGDERGE